MTNVVRDLFTKDEWEILCAIDSALCQSIEYYPQEMIEEEDRIYECVQ